MPPIIAYVIACVCVAMRVACGVRVACLLPRPSLP